MTPRRGIGALIAVVIVVAVGLVIALGGGSQPTAARSLGVKGDGLPSLFASLSPTSRQRLLTMPFATRVRVLRTLKAADAEVARPVHTMPVYRGPASRIRRFHGASPVVDGVLPHAPRPVPGAAGRLEWSGRIVFRGGRFLSPPGERNASGVGEVQVFGESEVCWRLSHIVGLHRPLLLAVLFAPGRRSPVVAAVTLGPYQAQGCETGLPVALVSELKRYPARYLLGITDSLYPVAAAGRL